MGLLGNYMNAPGLMPSPTRSALAQSLLEQSMQTPAYSTSLPQSLSIAARPILAALLAKREESARKQQAQVMQAQQQRLAQALATGDARTATMLAGSMPGNPMAEEVLKAQTKGVFDKPETMTPLSADEKRAVGIPEKSFAQRNSKTGKIEVSNPPSALVNINNGPTSRLLTPDEKQQMGIPKDSLAQIDQSGKVSVQNPRAEQQPSERERTASFASQNLLKLENSVRDVVKANPTFDPTAMSNLKGRIPVLGEAMSSPGFQQYRAAADEWTTNMVFLRSGATAREEEKTSTFQNFWPQPNNDANTVLMKERLRLGAEENAYMLADRANRIGSDEASQALDKIQERLKEIETMPALIEAARKAGRSEAEIIRAIMMAD